MHIMLINLDVDIYYEVFSIKTCKMFSKTIG
jgi:hypothetical protein